ncbi:MAG TPA: hypothetical protein DGK91_05460 [Clostridium sp.]|nr:hypothetical protein [Clostridium sp.]
MDFYEDLEVHMKINRKNCIKNIVLVVACSVLASNSYISHAAPNLKLDVNGDGVIDRADYLRVKFNYNGSSTQFDVNSDGVVDIYDMTAISASFNPLHEDNGYYAEGNSPSNTLNSALVAYDNDWLYYRNTQDGGRLYRSKLNSENRIRLTNEAVESINVIGNRIYYINTSDKNKIYSMKTDGSDRRLLLNESAENLIACGDKLFYKSKTDYRAYRINTDGTEKIRVTPDTVGRFFVRGDNVYYSNSAKGMKIYRVDIDGKNNELFSSVSVVNYAYEKGVIYYVNAGDNKIYSLNLQNKASKKIVDDVVMAINVKDGFIYYSLKSDGSLYKVKVDGTGRTSISGEKVGLSLANAKISVDAGWIYYTNSRDENRLYAITTEGRNKKDMETPIVGIVDVSSTLSFRQGPSTSHALLAALPKGTKLDIIDRTSNNGSTWYKAIYRANGKEQIGYVSAYYIIVMNDDRMWNHLGVLSEKYESNGDPGTISNTKGDLGGKSYGAWQFSTNWGTLTTFFYWLEEQNKAFFDILNAGWVADGNKNGEKFDEAWKYLATNHYHEFYSVQHKYTKMMYYDRAVSALKNRYKIDFNTYSFAFRNAVWSTAVHHGVGGATNKVDAALPGVISTAIEESYGDEREIIQKIYAQRSKTEIYFSGYDQNGAIVKSLKNRFVNECEDALQMYDYSLSAGE